MGPKSLEIPAAMWELSGPVLRDTARLSHRFPPISRYGFLVSEHGQVGAIPPPPFLSVSPLESMRSGDAIPPHKRGISAILARYPMKERHKGAIPPSAILSRKGIARYGGVSRTGPLSVGATNTRNSRAEFRGQYGSLVFSKAHTSGRKLMDNGKSAGKRKLHGKLFKDFSWNKSAASIHKNSLFEHEFAQVKYCVVQI